MARTRLVSPQVDARRGGAFPKLLDGWIAAAYNEHRDGGIPGGVIIMRWVKRALPTAAVFVAIAFFQAPPASATVHEIVAQWCAGQGELFPPGLSGGSSADNFAQPLSASGFLESVTPYQDGVLFTFNFDNPNSKLAGTGEIVQLAPGVYVTGFELDPEFPAFENCPRLTTP